MRSANSQLVILSTIGLFGPGMILALISSGSRTPYKSNKTKYISSVDITLMMGYISMGLCSIIGCNLSCRISPRWCMSISCILMALYTTSFAYISFSQSNHTILFTQITSVAMGAGFGFYWGVQTTIITRYPHENYRGRCMAIYYILMNTGGILGGIIQYTTNIRSESRGISGYTYVGLAIAQFIGAILSLFLASPLDVRRSDSTAVMMSTRHTFLEEMKLLGKHSVSRWVLTLLLPYFTSYMQFGYTSYYIVGNGFNARSRGFGNIWFWVSRVVGSIFMAFIFDGNSWTKRTKSLVCFTVLVVVAFPCWIGAIFDQIRLFGMSGDLNNHPELSIDYKNSSVAGPTIALYSAFGFLISIFEMYMVWVVSVLSDDFDITGRNTSIYRCVQGIGMAVSWIAVYYLSPLVNCLINLGCIILSLPPLLYFSMSLCAPGVLYEADLSMEFNRLYDDELQCKEPPSQYNLI